MDFSMMVENIAEEKTSPASGRKCSADNNIATLNMTIIKLILKLNL